uniref:NCK adaptor protein n=1 Tax=Meloidogyne javanica TaxID=6303 RepID=A0A915N3V9_MELJA
MSEEYIVAEFDYQAQEDQELSLVKGERLVLIDDNKLWWKARNMHGDIGFVPSNYVRKEASNNNNAEAFASSDRRENVLTMATVLFNYTPQREDELPLKKGTKLVVLDKSSDGWWKGEEKFGNFRKGWFPSNYVKEGEIGGNEEREEEIEEKSVKNGQRQQQKKQVGRGQQQNEHLKQISKKVLENYIEIVERNPLRSAFENLHPNNNKSSISPSSFVSSPQPCSGVYIGNSNNQNTNFDQLSGPYSRQPWYYGHITREQADLLLKQRGSEGDFLVRDRESMPGDFSISLRDSQRNKHFWIHYDSASGQFNIGNKKFNSMEALIM